MKNFKNLLIIIAIAFLPGCGFTNPETPVGHRGYVYSKPMFFGGGGYVKTLVGPAKLGMSWQQFVINVDVRPKPFNEHFKIRMKDSLNVEFDVTVKAGPDPDQVKALVEDVGENWYERYVQPEFKTICRKTISKYESAAVTQRRDQIAEEIMTGHHGPEGDVMGLMDVVKGKPIIISAVVVGNIDFPDAVDQEIERKLAKQQELKKQATQLEIAKKEAQIKVEEAKGIARSQEIINKTLTTEYLQHEAISTAAKLATSPNTTFYFVPTSPNGMGMPIILGDGHPQPKAK